MNVCSRLSAWQTLMPVTEGMTPASPLACASMSSKRVEEVLPEPMLGRT